MRPGWLPRTAELKRHKRLRSTKPLQRHTPLTSRPGGTGPNNATRALVYERDDWRCFCCGTPLLDQPRSLQHRDDRGMGGTSRPLINSPANLILMAGTATTGCHGRVERRRPADNDKGYWLKTGQDPALTKVWHWAWGWVLLGHDGSITAVEADAA